MPLDVVLPPNPSVPFQLGKFTHFNFPINSGTSITGLQLTLTTNISIDNEDDNGPQNMGTFSFVYDIDHWETTNTSQPCADGGTNYQGVNVNGCADRVQFAINTGASDTFTVGDTEYVLDILGFMLAGQEELMTEFWTVENQTNTAYLYAQVRSFDNGNGNGNDAPEPASLALLGLGLAGLGFAGRRNKKA